MPVCVLICLDVFIGFQDQKLVKDKQKIADLAPKFLKSNLGALILCCNNPNDSLRSYMIETDLPVCVLICLDIYLGLQKQKLVTNKQKLQIFPPKF